MVWSGVAELGRLVSGLFLISVNSVSLGTTFQSLLLPVQVPYLTPCVSSVSNYNTLTVLLVSTSPLAKPLAPGLTLTQLLDEVQEDQDHRGALVRLAESCLMLSGPCTATPVTHWTASCLQATVSGGLSWGGFRVRARQLPC